MTQGFQITSAAVSDRGLSEKRPQNEDSYLSNPTFGIFAVADGVGGAQARFRRAPYVARATRGGQRYRSARADRAVVVGCARSFGDCDAGRWQRVDCDDYLRAGLATVAVCHRDRIGRIGCPQPTRPRSRRARRCPR